MRVKTENNISIVYCYFFPLVFVQTTTKTFYWNKRIPPNNVTEESKPPLYHKALSTGDCLLINMIAVSLFFNQNGCHDIGE